MVQHPVPKLVNVAAKYFIISSVCIVTTTKQVFPGGGE